MPQVFLGVKAASPLAFAALVLLALTGAVLFYLVAGVERVLVPWAHFGER